MRIPKRVLVIVMRRIGDVLLITPLIRSLRFAWPDAAIDVLAFEGTEGVIAANGDIRRILSVPEGAGIGAHLRMLKSILRRYDVAISTQSGDRPSFYAWAAGKTAIGTLEDDAGAFWKRRLLTRWTLFDNRNTHTVVMNLRLAELLGIERKFDVVVSWHPSDENRVSSMLPFDAVTEPYAVLHPFPKFNYKMWNQDGWAGLARRLLDRGLRVVFTGSSAPDEISYVKEIARGLPEKAVDMAGRLNLGETGFLLSRARVYAGPDTVVTHMAAALGVPTVALYGPTNPVKWGPWPKNHVSDSSPYAMKGSQRVGNVILLQGAGDCVPCREEGCEGRIDSFSKCLLELTVEGVIEAVDEALGLEGRANK
jgi:heptosyltransferase-3